MSSPPINQGEQKMEKMLTVIFDTAPQALKGVLALKELHLAGDITLYSTAVIEKALSGTITIKQASERKWKGTPLGLLSGVLLGAWAGPIGLAITGAIGGLVGLIYDLAKAGVSAGFLEQASQALAPGKTALLAEMDESSETPVDMKFVKMSGHVCRQERSEFVEDQLLEELEKISAALN